MIVLKLKPFFYFRLHTKYLEFSLERFFYKMSLNILNKKRTCFYKVVWEGKTAFNSSSYLWFDRPFRCTKDIFMRR